MKHKPTFLFYLARESSGLVIALLTAIGLLIYTIFLDNCLYHAQFKPIPLSTLIVHLCNVFLSFFVGFVLSAFLFGVIRWRRRTNYSFVLLKTVLMTVFLALFLGLHISLVSGSGESSVATSNAIQFLSYEIAPLLIFTWVLSFCVNLISYIIRTRGFDFYVNSLSNKFNRPRNFENFVMFLDLNDSTPLLQQLGGEKYYSLQSEFFKDLEVPVYHSEGKLVEYVGDEVAILWRKSERLANDNCIKFFLFVRKVFENRRPYYLQKYGVVPEFKASIHFGSIRKYVEGYNRVDVVSTGRPFQICARIIAKCHELESSLLLSADAYAMINKSSETRFQFLGEFELKGVSHKVGIYRAELE